MSRAPRRGSALSLVALAALAATAWPTPARAQDAEDDATAATATSIEASYVSEPPGVVLSWSSPGSPWTPVTAASGLLRVPAGPIDLGLSYHEHGPVRVATGTTIPEGALLSARYQARQWMRELGVGVVLGGILAALVGLAIGIGAFVDHTTDTGVAGLAAGLGVAVVGVTTGLVLALQEDEASLDVE